MSSASRALRDGLRLPREHRIWGNFFQSVSLVLLYPKRLQIEGDPLEPSEFPSRKWLFRISRSCTPSSRYKIWYVPMGTHTTSCSAHLTHLVDFFQNPTFGMGTREQSVSLFWVGYRALLHEYPPALLVGPYIHCIFSEIFFL